MELYVYQTPAGTIADFRPYLDGWDRSFETPRELDPADPRWEKINNLRDPRTDELSAGKLVFVGKSSTRWHELMVFPLAWDGPVGNA